MATSTVLRVKRRLEDNPQDALVLLCKRMKTDSEEISPSLFVFRCSVKDQKTDVKAIPEKKSGLKHSTNVNDIIEKIRKERKDVAAESRYEIVNCSRGIEGSGNEYDFVDLQKKDDQENEKFMYDLYTAAKEDFNISMLDNIVSIENYETDLIFGSHRDNGLSSSDEDSEDSNAENDWRNEYPDSDPSSIDEEDLVKAVNDCKLEDDLSSDAGEDNIYESPLDLFNQDVKRYGKAYAEYKARVLSEQPDLSNSSNYVHCVVEESYKSDSDDGFYYGQEQDSEHFREQYADALSDPD